MQILTKWILPEKHMELWLGKKSCNYFFAWNSDSQAWLHIGNDLRSFKKYYDLGSVTKYLLLNSLWQPC